MWRSGEIETVKITYTLHLHPLLVKVFSIHVKESYDTIQGTPTVQSGRKSSKSKWFFSVVVVVFIVVAEPYHATDAVAIVMICPAWFISWFFQARHLPLAAFSPVPYRSRLPFLNFTCIHLLYRNIHCFDECFCGFFWHCFTRGCFGSPCGCQWDFMGKRWHAKELKNSVFSLPGPVLNYIKGLLISTQLLPLIYWLLFILSLITFLLLSYFHPFQFILILEWFLILPLPPARSWWMGPSNFDLDLARSLPQDINDATSDI